MGRLWKLVLNWFVSFLANYSVQGNGESIAHLPLTVYISVSKNKSVEDRGYYGFSKDRVSNVLHTLWWVSYDVIRLSYLLNKYKTSPKLLLPIKLIESSWVNPKPAWNTQGESYSSYCTVHSSGSRQFRTQNPLLPDPTTLNLSTW